MLESIAQIATLIGLAIGVFWGVYVYRRQMNAQLFLAYTDRYREAMRNMPAASRDYRLASNGEPPPESPELTASALEYLNLCSEEFYLCQRGYLSKDIWRIWETELIRTLRSPLFRREWNRLKQEFASYSAFVRFVESTQE